MLRLSMLKHLGDLWEVAVSYSEAGRILFPFLTDPDFLSKSEPPHLMCSQKEREFRNLSPLYRSRRGQII